jgi:sugar phosphate isomerase/epimerase
MRNDPVPTIGASLSIETLPLYRDWLMADQRDLEIDDPCCSDMLDGDWRPRVRQARDLLDGYAGRLSIHGPWQALPLLCYDARVREVVVTRLKQALEFGAELGATQMVVHSPFEFYGHPQVAHTAAHGLAEEIEQVHETLAHVLPLAQQANCALVLEVSYDTHSMPLVALVHSFESDQVQVSLDTGHAFVLQRIGGPPPDQWVRDAGKLLTHLHIQDSDGLLDRHWPPGRGNINWYALFEALGELQHQPRLLLEIDHAQVRQGADWLIQRGFVR